MSNYDDFLTEEDLDEEEPISYRPPDDKAEDPEPGKPRKTQAVLVPNVQNMDDYMIKHHKAYIIQELNKHLVDGELAEIVGIPVKSERIVPNECCFRRFSYWRLNQYDLLIDIDLRVELRVDTPSGIDTDFYSFYVELWFSFCDDEEECTFLHFGLLENKPEHEGEWKLDKYLVPVLRRDEIDEYAEELWADICPDAAKDQKLRRPHTLTEKLHLSVVKLPLYKRGDTRSIIFFREGTVMVRTDRMPGDHDEPPPIEQHIPANTIVINSHSDSGMSNDLDIYHECIHYEWHYLFYRLQDMHNNDLKQLKKVRRSAIKDKNAADPTYFIVEGNDTPPVPCEGDQVVWTDLQDRADSQPKAQIDVLHVLLSVFEPLVLPDMHSRQYRDLLLGKAQFFSCSPEHLCLSCDPALHC